MRGVYAVSPKYALTLAALREAVLGRRGKQNKQRREKEKDILLSQPHFGCLQRANWTHAGACRLLHALIIHQVCLFIFINPPVCLFLVYMFIYIFLLSPFM